MHRSQNYIQELRNCSTKEAEQERVDKELGKIRKKYTSDKILSGGADRWPCTTPRGARPQRQQSAEARSAACPAADPPRRPAAYDKRKYMWKLLYTRMLGYDVEFGQKQAMDLIAATG